MAPQVFFPPPKTRPPGGSGGWSLSADHRPCSNGFTQSLLPPGEHGAPGGGPGWWRWCLCPARGQLDVDLVAAVVVVVALKLTQQPTKVRRNNVRAVLGVQWPIFILLIAVWNLFLFFFLSSFFLKNYLLSFFPPPLVKTKHAAYLVYAVFFYAWLGGEKKSLAASHQPLAALDCLGASTRRQRPPLSPALSCCCVGFFCFFSLPLPHPSPLYNHMLHCKWHSKVTDGLVQFQKKKKMCIHAVAGRRGKKMAFCSTVCASSDWWVKTSCCFVGVFLFVCFFNFSSSVWLMMRARGPGSHFLDAMM